MGRKAQAAYETEIKTFPVNLKNVMEERGLNQTQLQKAILEKTGKKIQRQTISLYGNGQSSPDVERLKMLCDALEVSADYLLGISKVKIPDSSIQGAARATGLNETAILSIISQHEPGILSKLFSSKHFEELTTAILDLEFACNYLSKAIDNPDSLKKGYETLSEKQQEEMVSDYLKILLEKVDYQRYRAAIAFEKILNTEYVGQVEEEGKRLQKIIKGRKYNSPYSEIETLVKEVEGK